MVGDAQGSTPFRLGIQTSSPGYRTPLHSHPYMEALTVLEGEGIAWMEGREPFPIAPGMTLVFPANTRHWFARWHAAAHDLWNSCLAASDRDRA